MLGGVASGSLLVPSGAFSELLAWGERVRASMPSNGGPDSGSLPAATLLTPPRARAMEALSAIIIPETDTPGAAEAGVSEFVAALVDGWLDDDHRDRFLAGLDTVDPAPGTASAPTSRTAPRSSGTNSSVNSTPNSPGSAKTPGPARPGTSSTM